MICAESDVTRCHERCRMKRPLSKKLETAASDSGNKSFTVRLRAETAAEVQKIALRSVSLEFFKDTWGFD